MSCPDAALLLCSDLDGTLIPNGTAPESPAARPLFRRFAAHPGVCLAYVTGRDPGLVEQALTEAGLPEARIRSVSGRADRDPMLPDQPNAAANRRVSITLLRQVPEALP